MTQPWADKLRKIDPYIPGEQSKDKNIIKLNANENPYPPSPKVQEAIARFDTSRLRLYPDANASKLKRVLAQYYHVEENQIFLGNGSDEMCIRDRVRGYGYLTIDILRKGYLMLKRRIVFKIKGSAVLVPADNTERHA